MSVAEMLAHLASSTHWAEQLHFAEQKREVAFEDFGRYTKEGAAVAGGLKTKADIIAALETRGNTFASRLEQMTTEQAAESRRLPAADSAPDQVAVRDADVGEGARDAPSRSADADRTHAGHRPPPDAGTTEPVDPADGRRQTADGHRTLPGEALPLPRFRRKGHLARAGWPFRFTQSTLIPAQPCVRERCR